MKRTILSALLTSAGLTAGTVGGYLHDSQGAPIADARVSIYTTDNSTKQEATTGADGKFDLNVDGGKYVLRIEKQGYTSIFKAFDLKMDAKMDRDFTMSNEGSTTVADTAVGPTDTAAKHVRVGGQVAQANLLTKVAPAYPMAAKKAAIQGPVKLAVTISKEGIPEDLRVISSPSDYLSESAIEAVSKWVYKPTLLNGDPVEIDTMVIVNYTLSK